MQTHRTIWYVFWNAEVVHECYIISETVVAPQQEISMGECPNTKTALINWPRNHDGYKTALHETFFFLQSYSESGLLKIVNTHCVTLYLGGRWYDQPI